ncbi:MAG: CsbD family protein [Burkholderiales bacterium PBB4]|nr:MAG: CsbD family protein [Burkholderiales bacterium PBB4]
MNKQQTDGAMKDLTGKIQQTAGKLVGSKSQEIKGLQKQVIGKAEKQLGDAREAVKSSIKHSTP